MNKIWCCGSSRPARPRSTQQYFTTFLAILTLQALHRTGALPDHQGSYADLSQWHRHRRNVNVERPAEADPFASPGWTVILLVEGRFLSCRRWDRSACVADVVPVFAGLTIVFVGLTMVFGGVGVWGLHSLVPHCKFLGVRVKDVASLDRFAAASPSLTQSP